MPSSAFSCTVRKCSSWVIDRGRDVATAAVNSALRYGVACPGTGRQVFQGPLPERNSNRMDNMARINVDGLKYKELVALRADIEVAIAARKADDGKALKAQLAELAEKGGFSMEELFGKGRKTSKLAVKFRNPKAPDETWTGRGRKPNWLVAALKKGGKIESFQV